MKLQDAYVAEAAAMGDWGKIGYAMKEGDSFKYEDKGTYSDNSVLVEKLGEGVEGWRATSKVKLNDCFNTSYWNITVKSASNSAQGMVNYKTDVKAASGGTDKNCSDLTPSFKKLDSESNS